jgi:hypothetical protein
MQRLCANAVSTLAAVMHDTTAPASARVSAAKTILEQSIGGVELTELRQEVEDIKGMLAEREGKPGATRARA